MPTNKERQKFRSFAYRQLSENFENLERAFQVTVPDNAVEKWQRAILVSIYSDLASLCRIRYHLARLFSRF